MRRVYELTEEEVRTACAEFVAKLEFKALPSVPRMDVILAASLDDRTRLATITASRRGI